MTRAHAGLLIVWTAVSREGSEFSFGNRGPIIALSALYRAWFISIWPVIDGQMGNQKTLGRGNF